MLRKVKSIVNEYRLYIILIILFSFAFIFLNKTYTEKTTSSIWDGTVSSTFEYGNGTIDNPYMINNGSEFALFLQTVNSDNSTEYFNKYYKLNNNINFNNIPFNFFDNTKLFAGFFDGQGYNLYNLNITGFETNESIYYSIFGNIENAHIQNINIYDIDVNVTNTDKYNNIGIVALNTKNSVISNVNLSNINIINSCGECVFYSSLTVLNDNGDNSFNNININGNSDVVNTKGLIYNYSNSTVSNIIYNIGSLDLINNYNESDNTSLYKYYFQDNKIKFKNNIPIKTIVELLNTSSEYEWEYDKYSFNLINNGEDEINKFPRMLLAMSAPSAHSSGIDGNVVYINDYESDYNYFMGLNFTYNSSHTIPTLDSKNVYSDSNLVYVNANYYAADIEGRYSASVSLTETQNQFSYYKVYEVNKNGTDNTNDDYIEFDLIDNPFTKRPNNMGFNGWVTNHNTATLTLDMDTYTRKVRIPVSYSSGKPSNITINFYASWTKANVVTMNGSSTWTDINTGLESGEMNVAKGTFVEYESVSNYYIKGTISLLESYPSNSFKPNARSASGRCLASSCDYYKLSSNSVYDPSTTYYTKGSSSFSVYTPRAISNVTINKLATGAVSANYFLQVLIPNGNSISGYYNTNGVIQSGNCSNSSGCTLYDMIPYKDENGNVNVASENTVYYYLVTRDINIVVLTETNSNIWSSSETKPFTFTSLNNGVSYASSARWNVGTSTITAYSDINIENMVIQTNTNKTTSTVTPGTGAGIQGNWYNVKLGRGITQYNSKVNLNYIMGGVSSTTGSSSSLTKYTLIVESGLYNSISCIVGTNLITRFYVKYNAIFGSDYDRVSNNNNKLDVAYDIAGTFGGLINSANYTDTNMNMIVKSGKIGSNEYDYTTGIYVGGRGITSTNVLKTITVEGGQIYNLIGEPGAESVINNYNAVTMYIKGGTINMVYGGAGETETDGNRVIQMTGGTVNYSVFGGSNGSRGGSSSLNNGKVNGDSYIYIGGNATVGSETLVNNNSVHSSDNVEAGSVFGVGNGNSNYSSIGTMDNSNIIIADSARVLKNVYGGGNYGAAGYQTNNSSTNIKIIGGTISGSVYGGGNNNGAGASSYTANVNITMTGGVVNGSIFGGSKSKGIIYGDATVNINGGTVYNNIYGGGEGGYSSSTNYGTYVKGNSIVNIGTTSSSPTISGNVYGGSAYGTVNAYYDTENSVVTTTDGKNVVVNVNNGNIAGSVFGGAKGDSSYTPYIKGNITVNINGGTISKVYGGFDAAGTPEADDYVYLNSGTIGSAFGGGASTSITTSNIYLQGSIVTNIYGGSDQSGTVTTTNVSLLSGNATYVYGGNNAGGTCDTTNVIVKGGTLNTIYGGGNVVGTTTTNVKLYNNASTISYVYGGGNQAGATTTNVTAYRDSSIPNTIKVSNLFGGSNKSGTVTTSNVIINYGKVSNLYGGNNAGGKTNNPNVTINAGTVSNAFGGGNKASSPVSHVTVNGGTTTTLYGGGKSATVTTSNVTLNAGKVTTVYGGGSQAGCTTTNVSSPNTSTITVTSLYGGSNKSGNITTANVLINAGTFTSVFGGNNAGGITSNPLITVNGGTITTIYGGGNLANVPTTSVTVNGGNITNVFGGGKQATVSSSTNVSILGGTVTNNVYGGGDEGVVTANTFVYINNAIINGSAYAGGNGSTATVNGNTNIFVGGNTVIGTSACMLLSTCSVFGGGNAAFTGNDSTNNSKANVNILGGTIYGNVYGGANTSKVFGETNVKVGANATQAANVNRSNINITGTVFGGGEANAAGSATYDYNYISVTNKIDVDINGTGYGQINISGSIFGSGNASSTSGTSQINISNFGAFGNPKKITSIQRTDKLIIDASALNISGAADRTNDFSDVLFTLSLIEELDLKNNSTLYLETGTNLLKKFYSMTSTGQKAVVTIDKDNGTVTKNVDNRIYMYEGKNLNIATNSAVTSYGQVNGMTFFGLYNYNNDNSINVGIYNDYEYDARLSYSGMFTKGSYVLGAHKTNHDITVDGFYSNYMEDGTLLNKIDYVETVPEDASYYMWIVGELIAEYDIELVASKYSTLGSYEFAFTEFSKPNTSFEVLGFDYSELESGVELVSKNQIKKLASSDSDADSKFALVMESTNSGWLTSGKTNFYSNETKPIDGVTTYVGENSNAVPTLLFYLYHSKNIATTGDLGTVRIVLLAVTKKNELENETKRIVINVELSRLFSTSNDYEAALTSGKKYEMFSSTLTNITNKSSISAYFSLYSGGSKIYQNGYHRSLVSSYVLPENTKITMIDLSQDEVEYYYHVISSLDVANAITSVNNYGEAYYDLSMFEVMGASGSGVYYNDAQMNNEYYDSSIQSNYEEFIFIVDFEDTNISTNVINSQLLFEMQDNNDDTIFGVLGVQRDNMKYNIYTTGNAIIEIDGDISSNTIYAGDDDSLNLTINYSQSTINGNLVYDTSHYDHKLGTKITLINSDGEVVSGASLLGLYYEIDGVKYYPNLDGSTRVKIADRVGNTQNYIKLVTGTSDIATGTYTLRVETFASPDGIYYGINSSDYIDFTLNIINEIYGLDAQTTAEEMIIDADTGKNLNNNNILSYNISYNSRLASPNIHLKVSRRNYDSIYTTNYTTIDLTDYVTNSLYTTSIENEYLVINNPNEDATLNLLFKNNLQNGTYKFEFILYDGTTMIGSVDKYIIIIR